MTAAIDIDIGGTFTDCYVTLGDRRVWCKTRTTAFNLSVGMNEAIAEAAGRLGVGLDAPLHAVAHRWRYAQVTRSRRRICNLCHRRAVARLRPPIRRGCRCRNIWIVSRKQPFCRRLRRHATIALRLPNCSASRSGHCGIAWSAWG